MNLETITVRPVPVKPTKTYVLTLTEVEAQALKALTGMQSAVTIARTAKASVSLNGLKEAQIDTVRVVNDKLYDCLHNARVDDMV